MPIIPEGDRLLTPAEVAAMFRVDPKTVARWARTKRIAAIMLPGGRLRRYPESAVRRVLNGQAVNV
ncbi:helix-turn-helix domain-containing protein [Microtetraspora malaysiensis]|uniref:helix-turn-helix domain-containing protein n=1 Tax=Microtetraspora malaysiensis TaxID=161358 RepID=UPI003D8C94C5